MYYPRFHYSKISMEETINNKVYIPALLINIDAFYMINNTLDSLDFTDWIWGFQLNLSSIIIPKNLVAATRGNTTLLMFNANSLSGGLLRNNMYFVFPKFNDNLLTEKHTKSVSSSMLIVSCKSCRLALEQNIFVSSANNTNYSKFDTLHISLM